MTKRLVLKSETVAELTVDELAGAVVGASGPTCVGQTCPVGACATERLDCWNLTHNCW